MHSGLAVVTLLAVFAVAPLRGPYWWVGALMGLLALVGTVPLTVRRLRAVLASDRPLVEAAQALVLVFTTLVVGFAAVFYVMAGAEGQFDGLNTRVDAVYFTVTTLSTVGFGDVVATGQAARVAVTCQVVFSVTFISLAARVLIGTATRRTERRRSE